MRAKAAGVAVMCLTMGFASASARGAEPIFPKDFDKLHALISPAASEEKWLEIPWMTNLWAARQKAAAEGKPILLWEMDGHPLGCT